MKDFFTTSFDGFEQALHLIYIYIYKKKRNNEFELNPCSSLNCRLLRKRKLRPKTYDPKTKIPYFIYFLMAIKEVWKPKRDNPRIFRKSVKKI